MKDLNTISWIFLAIALGSEKSPIDSKAMAQVADGINHAIPTHSEIQDAVSWLLNKGLIVQSNDSYSLSDTGRNIMFAASKTHILSKIWKNIEAEFQHLEE